MTRHDLLGDQLAECAACGHPRYHHRPMCGYSGGWGGLRCVCSDFAEPDATESVLIW